ncbi:hypothetical protein TD95_004941 [Thielaviopsis punctulata]|uniref:Nab2-like CCCH zinc finger domain-containing protein n=1 Tax=Thielaviopsis punctulata TaxID=72032 RepID=A0A0F4ZF26_9PEZI|nr:hypothetical protein TD95_004941 [Thielaviopsis punctulata]
MPVIVQPDTPLAEALNAVIQPKLQEVGWGSGDPDDTSLAEYIVLMLINGRSQEQVATDISKDLLDLDTVDPMARDFSQWLFAEVEAQNARLNGGQPAAQQQHQQQQQLQQQPPQQQQPPPQELMQQQQGFDGQMYDPSTNAMIDGDSMDMSGDMAQINVPTGPRSMRNGMGNNMNNRGRDRRMFNQMNKSMDRSVDNALHRVRGGTGNERINSHRNLNNGMGGMRNNYNGLGRGGRNSNMNNRSANVQAGLAAAAMGQNIVNLPTGMGMPNGNWNAMGGGAPGGKQPSQMDLFALLEQQNRMMAQLSQQMMQNNRGGRGGHRGGRRGGHNAWQNQNQNRHEKTEDGDAMQTEGQQDGDDVSMGAARELPNPDESMCKYNQRCTNKDCKFAHASPAAPPGVTVDVKDTCSFGAACKNWKCVGRHPSPAARLAHQSEQDCKFFPNCQNPHCPFKHPSMPICANGAGCTTPDCKYTHVKTKCRFNPCLNPKCMFVHEEGQQGGFKDKVWTPEGGGEHISERKFVIDEEEPEQVKAEEDTDIA